MKDKLFAKLPLYLRYFQTKKREEEISNDKKNYFQPTGNYQPDPTVHIVRYSQPLETFLRQLQENYSRDAARLCACEVVSRDRKVASMAQEGECIASSFKSTN